MTGETYPTDNSGTTANLSYTFDSMGRLNTMTDNIASETLITGASYGPANELLSVTGGSYGGAWAYGVGETRTYNSLKQLTEIVSGTYSTPLSITYHYPSTGNNGKISSQTDNVSGEKVSYAYDALNRLATAANQSGFSPLWGQQFAYDGFGNLTEVSVTQGSAPILTASYDYNNHAGGEDSNGNPGSIYLPADGSSYSATYDVENRLVATGSSTIRYSYAPGNKRVWRGVGSWNSGTGQWSPTDEVTFWSVTGQKLATYQLTTTLGVGPPSPSEPQFYATQTACNYYFGGKLIKNVNGWVYSDRLASIGKFYPYGMERPSATTNGTEKFTGYFRDAETGNDYAVNRYMSPGMGRLLTVDPSGASWNLSNPGSWNSYTYALDDPINNADPSGLTTCGDLYAGGVGDTVSLTGSGSTVSSQLLANTPQGHFADLVYEEAGTFSQSGYVLNTWDAQFEGIAQAIWDRFLIVTGAVTAVGANGTVFSGKHPTWTGYLPRLCVPDTKRCVFGAPTLNNVLIAAAAGTSVLNSSGQLNNMSGLQSALNSNVSLQQNSAGSLVPLTDSNTGGQIWVTPGCYSAVAGMEAASDVSNGSNFNPPGWFLTSWGNVGAGYVDLNYAAGIESVYKQFGDTTFYGFTVFRPTPKLPPQ